jgi:hypothetical protein
VTPEIQYLGALQYVLECANYQRGDCRGNEPVPPKFPTDVELKTKSKAELSEKRRAAVEHLRKRREQEVKHGD